MTPFATGPEPDFDLVPGWVFFAVGMGVVAAAGLALAAGVFS